MKKKMVKIATALSLLFTACQNTPEADPARSPEALKTASPVSEKRMDIPFRLAENYFVKSNAKKPGDPKIETAGAFNEIFGMAARMSEDGRPTEIDFSKQYVIAVILPEADLKTSIYPVSLQNNEKDEIILHYKIKTGEKQTYTTIPHFAIIVDKAEKGTLILKAQE